MTAARAALADAIAQFAAAGVGSPRVDAELVLAHVLGVARPRLPLIDELEPADDERFAELVRRRVAREPLQYIVGRAPFRYLDLAVGPGVFVPRPETELLVDAVLPGLADLARPLVVDLCAGSGALALAIATEHPGARVYAVECATAALKWLRRNVDAARAGVTVVAADVADSELLSELGGQVDAIVSNPPYVPRTTVVEPEVHADPPEAVFAGTDGMSVIPAVIARAAELLRAGGELALEHDDTHAVAVLELLRADGRWRRIAGHTDLAARPRFATARRVAAPSTAG